MDEKFLTKEEEDYEATHDFDEDEIPPGGRNTCPRGNALDACFYNADTKECEVPDPLKLYKIDHEGKCEDEECKEEFQKEVKGLKKLKDENGNPIDWEKMIKKRACRRAKDNLLHRSRRIRDLQAVAGSGTLCHVFDAPS